MMVRAMRAVDLVANSGLAICSHAPEAGGPTSMAVLAPVAAMWMMVGSSDAEFATRSTARMARTIIARKSGISVLPKVTFWLYFRSRSTARGARTIMAGKFGTDVLLPVALWLYFLNSVRGFRIHTPRRKLRFRTVCERRAWMRRT